MAKELVRSWKDAAELVKRRAEADSDGEAHIIVRIVEMNVEAADGSLAHDVYEGLIRYYADEELSGAALVEVVRHSYVENEKHLKEYKTERGVENYISRSIESPYIDGIIVYR